MLVLKITQGGYHELQNEPDGVKEKVAQEVITFIEEHLPATTANENAPTISQAAAGPAESKL